jgi:hypothetical protein
MTTERVNTDQRDRQDGERLLQKLLTDGRAVGVGCAGMMSLAL